MKAIMVDIESLDTDLNAAIVSVGTVVFEDEKIVQEDYWLLDWNHQVKRSGRSIGPDTLRWWMGQSDPARMAVTAVAGTTTNEDFIKEFYGMFKEQGVNKVYANGAMFDIGILEHFFSEVHVDDVSWSTDQTLSYDNRKLLPWTYRDIYCMRALKAEFEEVLPYGEFKRKQLARGAVAHNALDDARMQANYVMEVRKWINSRR